MSSSKQEKMRGLFHPETGKTVIIPVDHGLCMGVVEGLEDPKAVVKKLMDDGVDATLMSFGVGKITAELFTLKKSMGRIITADYILMSQVPGVLEGVFGNCRYSTVEQAVKWGFDAVKVMLVWGTRPETQLEAIKYTGHLAAQCDKWGMPLMVEPVLLGEGIPGDKKNDPEVIQSACRIAVELGADILKAPYTGDKQSFGQIVQNSHLPVVVLGGPKMKNIKDVLQTAKDSVDAGGKGIVFGRNVWQHPHMDKVIEALKDIVHQESSVDEVLGRYGLM